MDSHPTESMSAVAPIQRLRPRAAGARPVIGVLSALPIVVLAAAFGWLALDHRTFALWNVVVHESGRYTFGQTVFYFGHFLREVPVAVTYALFLLAASGGAGTGTPQSPPVRMRPLPLLAAAALLGIAFIAAARSAGVQSALHDLLQYRTRDDEVAFGSHWHYHWLSTLWFGAAVTTGVWAAQRIRRIPRLALHARWSLLAWLWFAGLSIVFGVSADVFTNAQYAGHQAREIMTHAAVTLPAGIGLVMIAAAGSSTVQRRVHPIAAALAAAMAVLIPTHLAVITLAGGGVMEHGQTELGLGAMVAAHYFEHTLDYLFILLLLFGGLTVTRSHLRNQSDVTVATDR
jgi:hypothetical protein